MVLTIGGGNHHRWRAVDQDGFVLDALVQSRRDTQAAKRLLRKLLKKQGHLRRDHSSVTDDRKARAQAFQVRAEVAGAPLAA